MESFVPTANETDPDLLFPAIAKELDPFQFPRDISFVIQSPEQVQGSTVKNVPTAALSASASVFACSSADANLQSVSSAHSSVQNDPEPPRDVSPWKGRRRPTHALPRKQLLRWDYLLESLRGDHGAVLPQVADSHRREFDRLEEIAEEKRESKRRQQRERDKSKRSYMRVLEAKASAGDMKAAKEQAVIARKQRLKNMKGSARRKRQREDEVALQADPRCLVEPLQFSGLLKGFLASQKVFTGKVNDDFQRRLCEAAQSMYVYKHGVQQKLIHVDISIVNAHHTGVEPNLHPAMELSSQHLTAVVEKYAHGNNSALVRLLYLPIRAGTELHALDFFMKCNDPFITMPAKHLSFRTLVAKSLNKGHSSYNISAFPISDGLNPRPRNSEAISTEPQNPAWKAPETVFKVAKYEMMSYNSDDRTNETSASGSNIVFYGIEGKEVWEKCAELGIECEYYSLGTGPGCANPPF